MKKGYAYTILFMIILSAVLTLALASAYEAFKPQISSHARLREERAVLYAFGLDDGLTDAGIRNRFSEVISEGELNGRFCYVYSEAGQVRGYAIPFEGAGLWGTLRGYLGVNAALDRTTGLVFTAQSETPGLGGRIDEPVFKEQFRGLPLAPGTSFRYGTQDGYSLDAVTGATQTSSAVLRTINSLIADIIKTGGAEY